VPANESSLLLVTSRSQLTALSAHHAVHLIGIDVLEPDDAIRLLGRVLGAQRVDREPIAAAELVELCVRMPLALRIAAAILASRPQARIAELAASLASEHRLDTLAIEGDSRSVRAVFASAYHAVAAPAARLFRLLGLHPGVTFGPHLAAAAAAVPVADARRWIADLVAAHLVSDLGDQRYRFHDLIRLYAYECAQLEESEAARAETVARILDWYLAVAAAANRTLDSSRNRVVPVLTYPSAELPGTASHADTLAFLDGERPNLVPLVRYAADHGHHTIAWQLTYLLTGFFEFRGHWADRIEICRSAVAAAQRTGDTTVEGLMHSTLGVAYVAVRRFDEALEQLGQALDRMRAIGDTRGQGTAQNNIAVAYTELRQFDQALGAFQQAVALLQTANNPPPWIALALNNIGYVYAQMGRSKLSFEYLARALALIRTVGDPRVEAGVLFTVGQTHLRDGDHEAAIAHFEEALAIRRDIGDRRNEVDTLNHLGAAHLARSADGAALEHFQLALAISREIADQHVEAVTLQHLGRARLRLGDLDGAREYLELALAVRTRVVDAYEEAHIHRDLDELERRCGNPSAARRHLLRAIELYRRANATAEADQLTPGGGIGGDPTAGVHPAPRYRRQSVDPMVTSPTPSSIVPSEGSKITT
jgi:tetratricopeptide (TPR) repeat protein